MSNVIGIIELKETRTESQSVPFTYLHREYRISAGKTLADVSLESGDFLPDDATAEIIEAKFKPNVQRSKDAQPAMMPSEIVVVSARKPTPWA